MPVTYIDIFMPKPFTSGKKKKKTIKKRENVCLYCNRSSFIPHISGVSDVILTLKKKKNSLKLTQNVDARELFSR